MKDGLSLDMRQVHYGVPIAGCDIPLKTSSLRADQRARAHSLSYFHAECICSDATENIKLTLNIVIMQTAARMPSPRKDEGKDQVLL